MLLVCGVKPRPPASSHLNTQQERNLNVYLCISYIHMWILKTQCISHSSAITNRNWKYCKVGGKHRVDCLLSFTICAKNRVWKSNIHNACFTAITQGYIHVSRKGTEERKIHCALQEKLATWNIENYKRWENVSRGQKTKVQNSYIERKKMWRIWIEFTYMCKYMTIWL